VSEQVNESADAADSSPEVESSGNTAMARRFRGFMPVVIDVECGGFNCHTDAILQIAAVLLGFNEQGQLVREQTHNYHVVPFPGLKLEEAALKFTGIDPFHPFRIAHPEAEVFRDMFQHIRAKMKAEECKRAILVGHNAHFDHGFVRAAAERHNLKRNPFHPFSSLDTASMSALCFGQTVLARACDAAGLGFEPDEAHSARYDAEKTADLFCYMINRWQELGGWPPA
jgi:ribonuclease T